MPETATTSAAAETTAPSVPSAPLETPAEKTMRRWYEGKLAERLMQAASMMQDRALMRRGAEKQQNGTLGQADHDPTPDPMNISIGDQIIYQQPEATPPATSVPSNPLSASAASQTPLWQKALMAASLIASGAGAGAGIPWLLGAFDKPAATQSPNFNDTNTEYELSITPPQTDP